MEIAFINQDSTSHLEQQFGEDKEEEKDGPIIFVQSSSRAQKIQIS